MAACKIDSMEITFSSELLNSPTAKKRECENIKDHSHSKIESMKNVTITDELYKNLASMK